MIQVAVGCMNLRRDRMRVVRDWEATASCSDDALESVVEVSWRIMNGS